MSHPQEEIDNPSLITIFEFLPKFCKSCAHIENEIIKEFGEKISLVKVDKNDDNIDDDSLHDEPVFKFFRQGKSLGSFSGFDSEKLKNKIKEIL